jgi:hypothetical protein
MANKKQMTELELKTIVDSEIRNAMGYMGGDLSEQRKTAMEYYLGEPFGNEVEGRSQVVSTDVADVIEWILPSLLKTFATTDDAVRFDPVSQEDVDAAEQETDYCNHVFYKENNGFLVFYSWFKDALLQKNGIVKSYWDESEKVTREEYEDLDDGEFMLLMQDEELELVEHTEEIKIVPAPQMPGMPMMQGMQMPQGQMPMPGMPAQGQSPAMPQVPPVQEEQGEQEGMQPQLQPGQKTHDAVFKRTQKKGQVRIEVLPPEEYGISRNHNSVDPSTASFQVHKREVTISELIEMGFDKDKVESIPAVSEFFNDEKTARENLTDERYNGQDTLDPSMRKVLLHECYVMLDYDGDGVAELHQVFYAGEVILGHEPVDSAPFSALTPIILTHKFFGLSIADLIMDLQLIKSTIWRQMLDNMYLINNGRNVVNANSVNLDDLLVSRPGGIVRNNGDPSSAIVPLVTQPLGQMAYPMVEYIDRVREGRTGVTQASAGMDADILNNNKGDASVERVMTAAEQRVELVARIFAETGVKHLFLRIHELLQKHQDKQKVVQMRNKWVPVNPQEWRTRTDMTVNVGLGTGERTRLTSALMAIMNMQEKIVMNGGLNILVTNKNIYNTAKDFAKYNGVKDITPYLQDPDSQQAQQAIQQQRQQAANPPPDPTVEAMKIQQQIETQKDQLKAQEMQLNHQRELFKLENDKAKMSADFQAKIEELQRKYDESTNNLAAKLTELELKYNSNVPGSLV